jgi:hypothetical protein
MPKVCGAFNRVKLPRTQLIATSVCQCCDVEPFVNIVQDSSGGPYPCPCCHFVTLTERGGYEICPVCHWEDDGQDDHDADEVRGGPNYSLSLTEARANFLHIGAKDERFLPRVRRPSAEEIPT